MNGENDKVPAKSANRRAGRSRRRVVVVAFDGVEPIDVSGPSSVFGRANLLRPGTYEVVHAAVGGTSVRTGSGLTLSDLAPIGSLRGAIDTLLVAGGDEAGLRRVIFEDEFPVWIRERAARIRRIGSVCTGAFVLAATGLLDGRRAATHWASCDLLAQLAPKVRVDANAIYVVDPPFYTSAGVTAGIDLSLAMVEEDLGRKVAAQIARDMVLFLRRSGGQQQYSAALAGQQESTTFGDLLTWIIENPTADLRVPALAERAGMTERTFLRTFGREAGSTPAAFVRRARVECAQRLLETRDLPLKTIAQEAGFGSEDSLARAFRVVLGVTPAALRARF